LKECHVNSSSPSSLTESGAKTDSLNASVKQVRQEYFGNQHVFTNIFNHTQSNPVSMVEAERFQDNESDFSFKRKRKQQVPPIAVNNKIEEETLPNKASDSN